MNELNEETIDALCDKILGDPKKRSMLKKLMNEDKTKLNCKDLKTNKSKKQILTKSRQILNNVNKKNDNIDSPMSIFRRKLLREEQNPRRTINLAPNKQKPFNKILEGVKAFVEILVDGVSRSHYIKLLMKDMGAEIFDNITTKITHVVFLGGMYTTFHRATLIKAHLVSITWLDMCMKTSSKVCEKDYPAIDFHVSESELYPILNAIESEYKVDAVWNKNYPEDVRVIDNSFFDKSKSNSISAYITPKRMTTIHSTVKIPQDVLVTNFVTVRKKQPKLNTIKKHIMFSLSNMDSSSETENSAMSSLRLSSNISSINQERSSTNYERDANDKEYVSKLEERSSITESLNSDDVSKFEEKSSITESLNSDDVIPETQPIRKDMSLYYSNKKSQHKTSTSKKTVRASVQNKNDDISRLKKRLFDKPDTSLGAEEFKCLDKIPDKLSKIRENQEKQSNLINGNVDDLSSINILSKRVTSLQRKPATRKSIAVTQNEKFVDVNLHSSGVNTLTVITDNIRKPDSQSNRNKRKTMSLLEFNSESSIRSSLNLTTFFNNPINSNTKSSSSNYPSSLEDYSNISSSLSAIDDNPSTSNNLREKLPASLQSNTRRKTPRKSMIHITSTKITSHPDMVNDISRKQIDENSLSFYEINGTNTNETKSKPLKRKLYDPNEPIDSYNIDYDEEYNKLKSKTNNVSNVTKKTFDSSNLSPLCLADKHKSNLNFVRNYININNKINLPENISPTLGNKKTRNKINDNPIKSIKTKHLNKRIDSHIFKRRSTLEFQVLPSQKVKIKPKPRKKYITYRYFQKDGVKEFERVVKTLGEFYIEISVTDKTTHLVVPECVRTLNVLRAIARGCWILKRNWLEDSLRNGSWLPEEEYELTEFSPSVQQCRLQRQMFGSSFTIDIFLNCGSIFICKNSNPNFKYLEELVTLCKGKIVKTKSRARLIIGEYVNSENTICLLENWILDSIMFNEKMDYDKYVINRPNSPSI